MVCAIGNCCIPDLTPSDHFFARSYYVINTPIDLIQTIAKTAKAIFASLIAALFLGSSDLLNQCHVDAWRDVGYSFQMTAFSLFGIINPKRAWLEKANLHLSKRASLLPIYALIERESKAKTIAQKALTFGGMMESTLRLGTSLIRWGVATGMYKLSGEKATFTGLLAEGARVSVEHANLQIELGAEFLRSSSTKTSEIELQSVQP